MVISVFHSTKYLIVNSPFFLGSKRFHWFLIKFFVVCLYVVLGFAYILFQLKPEIGGNRSNKISDDEIQVREEQYYLPDQFEYTLLTNSQEKSKYPITFQ